MLNDSLEKGSLFLGYAFRIAHSFGGGVLFGILFSCGCSCAENLPVTADFNGEAFFMFGAFLRGDDVSGGREVEGLGVFYQSAFVVVFGSDQGVEPTVLDDMLIDK